MRHAYLIVAHTNWKTLNYLLEMLDDSSNDFYVLIDQKVKQPLSELICVQLKQSNLTEVPRIRVN